MNRIGVLKDVAYGAKIGGGTVASLEEVGLLQPGAMAIFNPSTGVLLAALLGNAVAALGDTKEVVMAFGRTESPLLVTVPRKLKDLNRVDARSFVKPVITIGGITSSSSLAFENTGDVNVKVADTTYSSRFGIPSMNATVYKTASMTPENVVDAVVAKLNASTAFGGVTATKIKDGGSQYFGITITPKKDDVQIEVAVGEMWQGAANSQTTDPVYGIGAGADIRQVELDCSVEEGNGQYIEYGTEHFSASLEAVETAKYDVITFIYDAYHMGATTKRHVSTNNLMIAAVNGAATFDADDVVTILDAVFPTAYSGTSAAELGAGDGGDSDGTP